MLELLDVGSLRHERVPLSSSLGRVLAIDIVAPHSEPEFPTASMDGYAIKFEDQELKLLRVVDQNPAGDSRDLSINHGECIKTFTGSKMPSGSDTLLQIENVSIKDDYIVIDEAVVEASSVRAVGESFKKGDVLIKKGTKIGFVEIGVMASLNVVMVDVALKPRIGVLSTGSEIVDLGECSNNIASIRSSNNYTLSALFESYGATALQLGTIKDDKQSITEALQNALESSDIVVTTGGVSVGDYDFVKDVVPRLGAEVIFKGVAIKPGRHIMLAKKGSKFIVSLPGFAYSSTVTGVLYVLPLIAKMLAKSSGYEVVEAVLDEDFTKRSPFSEFSACNLVLKNGSYHINFEGKKIGSSAILTNMLGSASLMITAIEDQFLPKGTRVRAIKL